MYGGYENPKEHYRFPSKGETVIGVVEIKTYYKKGKVKYITSRFIPKGYNK